MNITLPSRRFIKSPSLFLGLLFDGVKDNTVRGDESAFSVLSTFPQIEHEGKVHTPIKAISTKIEKQDFLMNTVLMLVFYYVDNTCDFRAVFIGVWFTSDKPPLIVFYFYHGCSS